MKHENVLLRAAVGLVLGLLLASSGHAQSEQKPVVKVPESGVPQIMTLEGTFVRAAYNREGYAILGYHVANLRSARNGCCSTSASRSARVSPTTP